jgi:hypothetical protein
VDFGPPVGGLHAERGITVELEFLRSSRALRQLRNLYSEHRLDESDSAFLDLQGDDVTPKKVVHKNRCGLFRFRGYRFPRLEPRRCDARVLAIAIPQRAESSNA